MKRDIRETELYREVEAFYRTTRGPASGLVSDVAEVSTNGLAAVFTGTLTDTLDKAPPTRICSTQLGTGDFRVLTFGPNTDRLPKYSPSGSQIAFLSDRHKSGDFQLYFLDGATGAARSTPRVQGWVEYFHWSPDGKRILLAVAGHGADVQGAQGAVTSRRVAESIPSWMPTVETGDESYRWRKLWLYEIATDSVRPISSGANVWEAVWCGNQSIAAIVSPGPGEGLWYGARLQVISIDTGNGRELYVPQDQLGCVAAAPSGSQVAVVEALCSDRGVVAGDLWLIETQSGDKRRVDTRGVDITYTEWRSDRVLLLGGHRGFETVVGLYDLRSGTFTETWSSTELSTGGRYVSVAGFGEAGDCVLVGESFVHAPELAEIRNGKYRRIRSFDLGYREHAAQVESVEPVTWNAPDGLEIQGWLLRPKARGPHPLVMNVHGGPVWHTRPVWLGRRGAPSQMLVKRGHAVFFPNPRGSSGRGQKFARFVLGDMGGADAQDCLSGLDHLVKQGIADPKRLGVTGGSYGGFMASWLITQDDRFAASVPVSPVTNQVTLHLTSNIPHFAALFLADPYTKPSGQYFQRSPVMHAHRARTPTLNICGALDRCTPPTEAQQFHNALLENKVNSVLLTYPEEGHGIRQLPAAIDYAARVVGWFERHLGSSPTQANDIW